MAAAVVTAMAATVRAQEPAPRSAPETPPRLSDVSEQERLRLQSLLESPHWAFRVFGLLRLERYEKASVEAIVLGKLHDPEWQVRCFAVHMAGRLSIVPGAEEIQGEEHPLVIRAMLRDLGPLPAARIERGTKMLLQADDVEDFILGVEIAAASDIDDLRRDAARRLVAFLRRVDDLRAAIAARRLGRLLGLADPPTSAGGWRRWLDQQHSTVTLPPPRPFGHASTPLLRPPTLGRSPVADLDAGTFARLREYLDALKQRDLDLVIVMDVTASMFPMINEARVGADELILFLADISRQARLGFVAYRDHDNPPVVEAHPFTNDVASIRRFLFGVAVSGGADYPEAVYEGLDAAAELNWNREGERQVILVGDAPPHERDERRMVDLLTSARNAGTTVHTVHVPMERPERFYTGASHEEEAEDRRWLSEYNAETAATFVEIARLGGGRMSSLDDAGHLVLAIMHFSIADPWWPVFDGFYVQYVELCR